MNKIALSGQELAIVKDIMKNYPQTVVFWSRIKNSSKQFSDLDLCIKDPTSDYEYELLKEVFEESDLPFTVDLVDNSKLDESFRAIINKQAIPLSQYSWRWNA